MKNRVTQQQLQWSSSRRKTVISVLKDYFFFKNLLLTLYCTPLHYLCHTVKQRRIIHCYRECKRKPANSNLQSQSILDYQVGRSWGDSQYLFTSEVTRHDIKLTGKDRSVNSFPVTVTSISAQPWCKGSHTGHNPPQLESLKEIPQLAYSQFFYITQAKECSIH